VTKRSEVHATVRCVLYGKTEGWFSCQKTEQSRPIHNIEFSLQSVSAVFTCQLWFWMSSPNR